MRKFKILNGIEITETGEMFFKKGEIISLDELKKFKQLNYDIDKKNIMNVYSEYSFQEILPISPAETIFKKMLKQENIGLAVDNDGLYIEVTCLNDDDKWGYVTMKITQKEKAYLEKIWNVKREKGD